MSPSLLFERATSTLLQDAAATVATLTSSVSASADMSTATETLVSMATSATSAVAAATTTAVADASGDGGSGECRLLGPFALIVQLALGGLAMLSLVYKRWRERPQRPLKIWFFDASKQVFGSVLVHIANVFMSMLTSGRFNVKLQPQTIQTAARLLRRGDDVYIPNPCSFYLLNLAIDTTIGIPILIILLRIITGLFAYTPWGKPAESIKSGNYGNPPNAWWWLKQSVIYFCGLLGMKICVLILFLLLPWLPRVGDWALSWTEGNERLQIVFVMMLFPLIMNAMQYYIIDSFIKEQNSEHQRLPTEDDGDDDAFDNALLDSDDEDEDDEAAVVSSKTKKAGLASDTEDEYNPDLDGQTVVGSSRSHEERGKLLPKELAPAE